MAMTKKHFISLADALAPVREHMSDEVKNAILRWCRSENSAFNTGRFMAYMRGECGPCGGKIRVTHTRTNVPLGNNERA